MGVLITLRRKILDILSWKVFSIQRRDQRVDDRIRGRLGKDDTVFFWNLL